jgi:SWI/SNF-related matrix-associated actin-dependent regulator 1 of chromatin subfamily A
MLKAVAPEVIAPYDTYETYARRFCDAYWDGFQFVDKGASHIEYLSLRLNSGFMLRRLKKDHLKELPDKQYQLVSLPHKHARVAEMLNKEFTFSKGDASHHHVGSEGAEIARLRHELALSKVDGCIEHIRGVLEETDKVVVFAYHHDVINKLREAFSYEHHAVSITGATNLKMRQYAVDLFQTDHQCRVFIGQIQAAGDTITLTAASTVIFVESSWVPGEVDQATDRLHRIGQKDAVLVQFLVIAKSLEEHMVRTLIDKKLIINRIVEDDGAYLFT